MDIIIRDAVQDDVPRIRAIYNDVVENSVYTFVTEPNSLADQQQWLANRQPHHPVLVSVVSGDVVGWASLSPWAAHHGYNRTCEVSFFVDQAYRGRGIGRRLLAALIEAGVERGCRVFISRIVVGNDPSIYLHEQCGFEHVGVQPRVGHKHGAWHDVVLLQKNMHE